MKLSILIVSYNVRDLLERCLRSLDRIPDDWEVIVVDNDSKDGTREMLSNYQLPITNYQYFLFNENVGFARGNIEAYKHSRGEYVLLLNPDTKVLPNAIQTMVAYFGHHPEAWVLGPKLLNEDGSIQRSVRGFPTLGSQILVLLKLHNYLHKSFSLVIPDFDSESKQQKQTIKSSFAFLFSFLDSRLRGNDKGGYFQLLNNYLLPHFDYSKNQEVDQVMGAALMTRRSVIEQVGFLDPRFKRIFEEVDFCYRVKKNGGDVVYLPDARIVHSKGASFGSVLSLFEMIRKQYYFNQGMLRFFWKHETVWQILVLFPFLVLSLCITVLLWALLKLQAPLVKNREW